MELLHSKHPLVREYLLDNFFLRVCRVLFGYYAKLVFTIYAPLKIEGQENLPKNQAFLICSNHSSHMDSAILGTVSCKTFNNLGALAAKDYWFDRKIVHVIANMMFHLVPISRYAHKRAGANKDSLSLANTNQLCQYFLSKPTQRMVLFPEGSRTKTGDIGHFKQGAALLSAQLNKPIVPVRIFGSYEAWGKGHTFLKPKKLCAVIGKPLYPKDFFEISENSLDKSLPKESLQKMTDSLQEAIVNLGFNK
jgi:1-acyl-sn-glycerol-3-phosphate acyltransferase/long-chain acyl-CoA synthetase